MHTRVSLCAFDHHALSVCVVMLLVVFALASLGFVLGEVLAMRLLAYSWQALDV